MKIWILSVIFSTQISSPNLPQMSYNWEFPTHEQCASALKTVEEAFQKELDSNKEAAALLQMSAECVETDIPKAGNYGK